MIERHEEVAALVTRAVLTSREIARLEKILDEELKPRLVQEATEALIVSTGERVLDGMHWTMKGEDGCVAVVNFPNRKLISQVPALKLARVKELAGLFFGKLFVKVYKPAEAFRELAAALMPKAKAEKLLEEMTEESSPRVRFETQQGPEKLLKPFGSVVPS